MTYDSEYDYLVDIMEEQAMRENWGWGFKPIQYVWENRN